MSENIIEGYIEYIILNPVYPFSNLRNSGFNSGYKGDGYDTICDLYLKYKESLEKKIPIKLDGCDAIIRKVELKKHVGSNSYIPIIE